MFLHVLLYHLILLLRFLEVYVLRHMLQEILTVKSDDTVGRVKTYEAIVKGENVPEPGVPESFKVLVKELQSLGLDVRLYSQDNQELELKENIEEGIEYNPEREKGQNILLEDELSDGYMEEDEDGNEIQDSEEESDELFDPILDDEDEMLLDDTDLGEDNLMNDNDILDDDNE